jgi:hypothetical protein
LLTAKSSAAYREIYKCSLAVDVILDALSDPQIKPSLASMRSVAVRIPILVALAQTSVAVIELRRFLELCFWSLFFSHHPIEWQHFEGKRGKGFTRDATKPIATAAHRDLNTYMAYAREYMEAEPSGFATKALQALENDRKLLNSATHAGDIARSPGANVAMDVQQEKVLAKFAALQKRLFMHCVIVTAAFNRRGFDSMPPEARAQWEWLLTPDLRRQIRASDFGLFM